MGGDTDRSLLLYYTLPQPWKDQCVCCCLGDLCISSPIFLHTFCLRNFSLASILSFPSFCTLLFSFTSSLPTLFLSYLLHHFLPSTLSTLSLNSFFLSVCHLLFALFCLPFSSLFLLYFPTCLIRFYFLLPSLPPSLHPPLSLSTRGVFLY